MRRGGLVTRGGVLVVVVLVALVFVLATGAASGMASARGPVHNVLCGPGCGPEGGSCLTNTSNMDFNTNDLAVRGGFTGCLQGNLHVWWTLYDPSGAKVAGSNGKSCAAATSCMFDPVLFWMPEFDPTKNPKYAGYWHVVFSGTWDGSYVPDAVYTFLWIGG